jgi:hypothetical protein
MDKNKCGKNCFTGSFIMSVLLSGENLINVDTLNSVSTEHSTYTKDFLYNQIPAKAFYFTSKTSQTIEIDLGSALNPKLISFINHNLTSGASVTLEANTTQSWGAPPYSQAVTWRAENMYLKFDETYRWFRVVISDASNPFNPRIGELVLSTYTELSITDAFIQGQSEGDEFKSFSQETPSGVSWDTPLGRNANLELKILKKSTAGDSVLLDQIRAFLRSISGESGRFVLVPDDTYSECYFMKVVGKKFSADRIFHNVSDLRDWSLPFKELGQGIELL